MSVRDALKLNVWAFVGVMAAFLSRALLKHWDLDGFIRLGATLLPLPPGLLYARSIWRWMLALDEMQRRIQLEAMCFATLGMLLMAMVADLLRAGGLAAGLNFGWEGYFVGTFCLWILGLAISNRRFR